MYKQSPDYEQKTKKELLDLILTHELTDLRDDNDYPTDYPQNACTITCNYALWSDYGGSTVDRSNQRTLLELFQDHGAYEQYTGYSGFITLIPITSLKKWSKSTLIDYLTALDSLQDYPLIADDDLSNLETEIFNESWDSYISSDIISSISKLIEIESENESDPAKSQNLYNLSESLNDTDYLYLPDPSIKSYRNEPHTPLTLLDTYWLYSDQTSDYPLYETATSAYVDTDKVAKWIYNNTKIVYRPADQTTIINE